MGHGSSRHSEATNNLSSEELKLVENVYKLMLKGSSSMKHDEVHKYWSQHLDETLLKYVTKFLIHQSDKRSKTINENSLQRLYACTVRGRSDERTSLLFIGYSGDDLKYEIPTEEFLQYIQATIKSFLLLQENSADSHFMSWQNVGCLSDTHRITVQTESLSHEIIKYGSILTFDQIEVWHRHSGVFIDIQSYIFQSLFSIMQKKSDLHATSQTTDLTLFPLCTGLENSSFFPSILTYSDVLFLNLNIPHELRNVWRLLFTSQIHGESFSTLLGKILKQGATIFVIKDQNNYVFGGFAPSSWILSPNFIGNQSCFLFQLEPKMQTFCSSGYNEHFQYLNLHQQTMPNGLLMGGQLNYPGLWLDCEFGKGQSNLSCTTFKDYVQLSSKKDFQIKHLEVWGVGPLPECDEENSNKTSILDKDPSSQVLLELAGKKMHSEGLRDDKQ